mgnify:CR=1 FL=1
MKNLEFIDDINKFSVESFQKNGFAYSGRILDKKLCKKLRDFINKNRPVKSDIFYKSEQDFKRKGRYYNYAPGKGNNFLEKCDTNFIEDNPFFKDFCGKLMGEKYSIMKKSIIRSTPKRVLPPWVTKKILNIGRPNLNPYILDKYQDVQYFLCTDFHQDKTRQSSKFVTVYIYLDDVDLESSALNILSQSYKLGFTTYPHNLRKSETKSDQWYYNDNYGNKILCDEILVTGLSGTVSAFHNLTLHGTGVNNKKKPRISLRYLIKNESSRKSLYSLANKNIYGKLRNRRPRLDVSEDGSLTPMGSSLIFEEKRNKSGELK